MPRLLERINFPKVIAILAITFVVAVGACGLTALSANSAGSLAVPLGLIELAAIILSAIGLVVILILWVITAIMRGNSTPSPDSGRPIDPKDDRNDN